MSQAQRGEVRLVDLGMVAKTRPVLILSAAYNDQERALVTFIPRTTHVRGTRFEVPHHGRGYDSGALLIRRLGSIDGPTLAQIETSVKRWLGLS